MTVPDVREPGPAHVPWNGPQQYTPLGVPLVDLLDRVPAAGVVVSGDLVPAIAGVPLVRVSLRAPLSSVNERVASPWPDSGPL